VRCHEGRIRYRSTLSIRGEWIEPPERADAGEPLVFKARELATLYRHHRMFPSVRPLGVVAMFEKAEAGQPVIQGELDRFGP